MDDNADYVTASGFQKAIFRVTTKDIPNIVEMVWTEFLIMKSIIEINQFQDGLNVLGISNLIKAHPNVLRELFACDHKAFTAMNYCFQYFHLLEAMLGRKRRLSS